MIVNIIKVYVKKLLLDLSVILSSFVLLQSRTGRVESNRLPHERSHRKGGAFLNLTSRVNGSTLITILTLTKCTN